jgi:hypothetical protein
MDQATVLAQKTDAKTWIDPQVAAREFPGFDLMGEFTKEGEGVQVTPSEGRFYLSFFSGGLPGGGWDGSTIKHQWLDQVATAETLNDHQKIDRSSKLTFAKPPADATVLFDGNKRNHWAFGKVQNGNLIAGAKTKRDDFTDVKLHFETRVVFKPELQLAHPDRGNSGVFLAGAYEVQICDTFGVDFAPDRWKQDRVRKQPDTWCGGIYGLKKANVNMCLPPLAWQSFDIDFTAARFADGKKISDARMTVYQNGVLIHDDVALKSGTGGGRQGPRPEVPSGPILLQNHHSPNEFRNIWVVEKRKPNEHVQATLDEANH